jgi:hypothetical protein
MRLIAYAIVFAVLVIVLGSASCSSTTGKACTSAGGKCLYELGGGGPVCTTQAAKSAQDCTSGSNAGGWVCCLDVPEAGEEDASAGIESGTTTVDGAGDAPSVDGSSDASGVDGAADAPGVDGSGTQDAATDADEAADDASTD